MSDDQPDEFTGTAVDTPSGTLQLVEHIHTGITGELYQTDASEPIIVKVFDESIQDEVEGKVRKMVNERPRDPTHDQHNRRSIIWPKEVVEDSSSSTFLGYSMRFADFQSANNALQYSMANLQWEETTQTTRFTTALNLAITVYALHEQGYALGDFHHENILVDDGYITLIECDSFHIPDSESGRSTADASDSENRNPYAGTESSTSQDLSADNDESVTNDTSQFHPRYTVPSDSRETLSDVRMSDRFSLSVHVFQLLMEGHHPYLVEGAEAAIGDWSDMIRNNSFPYTHHERGIQPHEKAPEYSRLPSEIQDLFEQCFSDEGKQNGEARPTPRDWIETLVALLESSEDTAEENTEESDPTADANTGSTEQTWTGIGILNRYFDADGVGDSNRQFNPRKWADMLQNKFSVLNSSPENEDSVDNSSKEELGRNPYEDDE